MCALSVNLRVLISMGVAIVTLTIRPKDTDSDLEAIKERVTTMTREFTRKPDVETKSSIEDLAFGLKELKFTFVMNESLGGPDPLAEKIKALDAVESCDVTDVRRALG